MPVAVRVRLQHIYTHLPNMTSFVAQFVGICNTYSASETSVARMLPFVAFHFLRKTLFLRAFWHLYKNRQCIKHGELIFL